MPQGRLGCHVPHGPWERILPEASLAAINSPNVAEGLQRCRACTDATCHITEGGGGNPQVGLNGFADWTSEEFEAAYLMKRPTRLPTNVRCAMPSCLCPSSQGDLLKFLFCLLSHVARLSKVVLHGWAAADVIHDEGRMKLMALHLLGQLR